MSEETVLSPITPAEGSLPPKVAPFGAVVPEAAPAPAPEAAPSSEGATKTLKLRPVIRKPVIRKPPAPGAAAPSLPASPAPAAAPAAAPAEAPAAPAAESAPAANPKSITGAIPAPAILKKTGIIAEGILTPSQAQAAKTKTSRISLESAMGIPPPSTGAASPLKTIKLRRPAGIKAPARPVSPISSSASPIKPAVAETPAPVAPAETVAAEPAVADIPPAMAPVEAEAPAAVDASEKKTVKLRRPSAAIKKPVIAPVSETPAAGDGLDDIGDIPDMAPIGNLSADSAPEKASPLAVITLVASIAAIAILGVVTYQLFSQSVGPVTGPNEFAFIEG